jgi:hypothetical protein
VFFAVSTQWRIDSMNGKATGIEYSGLNAAMDMLGTQNKKDIFNSIRIMERAAREAMNNG